MKKFSDGYLIQRGSFLLDTHEYWCGLDGWCPPKGRHPDRRAPETVLFLSYSAAEKALRALIDGGAAGQPIMLRARREKEKDGVCFTCAFDGPWPDYLFGKRTIVP